MNKRTKNIKKAMVCIWMSSFLLITGCWDYQELNEYGLVIAVGIDKSKKNDEYAFTFQLVNPSIISKKGSGNQSTPITTYSQSARTEAEASRKMTQQTSRRLFFSHRQVLVISEEVAKEGGLLQVLDILERDPQGRINYPVLIARNTQAKNVLSVLTPIEDISAFELKNKIETSEKVLGENRNTYLEEIIENITSRGIDVALGGVEITGTPKQIGTMKSIQQTNAKAQTKLSGLALFNEEKLIQWTDGAMARGVVFASDRIRAAAVNINCEKDNSHRLTIYINTSKTKLDAKISKNTPIINMNISAEGRLGEAECPIDLENPQVIKKLEKRITKEIKREIEMAVHLAQGKQSDVFGFGEAIHRADPEKWKKWKFNWKQYYSKAQVNIYVQAYIRTTGLRTNPYTMKKD